MLLHLHLLLPLHVLLPLHEAVGLAYSNMMAPVLIRVLPQQVEQVAMMGHVSFISKQYRQVHLKLVFEAVQSVYGVFLLIVC